MESSFLQQMGLSIISSKSNSTSPTDNGIGDSNEEGFDSLVSQNQRSDDYLLASLSESEIDALNACSPPTVGVEEEIFAIDFLSPQKQRANDNFIASLSESEIDALNACYYTTTTTTTTAAAATTTTTSEASSTTNKLAITESQPDPYSNLFFPTQDPKAPSDGSSSMMNLLPTPMGGSCCIVPTTDQVPLNQSLISQSNSLTAMFQPLPGKFKLPNTDDKGSLLANIGTSHIIGASKNTLVEADFGSSLIAAPSALVASPRSKLALPISLQAAASLSPTDKNKTTSVTMEDTFSSSFESGRNQRHRSQQSTRWKERYQELIQYQQEHGDCNVPYLWSNNRPLSEWVKRQRHQYKLKQEGRNSALTDKREDLLTQLGFVWNSRDSLWDGRFHELEQYFQKYGNLKVSKHTAQHRALSVWLKRQRHACRLYASGDRSTCMTEERMQKLLDLGVKIFKKH